MLIKPLRNNPYHPDVLFFFILIPFISAFNYYLTYSNIRFNGFLILTFTIDTVQGYLAWWGVRQCIFFLDKRLPIEQQTLKRLAIQIPLTLVVGLFIIAVLTEIVSLIARGRTAPLSFYTVDLFIISIWFFVINGFYIGFYYYNLWRQSEENRSAAHRIRENGLLVKLGRQSIRLEFDSILGFTVDDEYAIAFDLQGKKYYIDQSLDRLEKTVPQEVFFRLNRQFLLNRSAITGFRRIENGKLAVRLISSASFPTEVVVSRLKASAFRSWFSPND